MLADLRGRTAFVTGAASGIGRGIAQVLRQQGARVVVADVDAEGAQAVADELDGLALEFDVTDDDSVRDGFGQALSWAGNLDVLVNNAGVAGDAHADPAELSDADWDLTFAVNVRGVARCCQALMLHLRARGSGSIVNIASVAGHAARGTISPYAVSKSAVLRYTSGLAVALAPAGIRVNAVCPGAVWSDFQRGNIVATGLVGEDRDDAALRAAFERRYLGRIPLGRVQTPREVGEAVAFLASDSASCITGQCLHVDGGIILRD